MLINRVSGGENVTPEVETQTPIIQELAYMALTNGIPVKGKFLWLKTTSSGYVNEILVSTTEDAYTEGWASDGFYYIRIRHALAIDANGDTFMVEL